jgi:hypothetical protein
LDHLVGLNRSSALNTFVGRRLVAAGKFRAAVYVSFCSNAKRKPHARNYVVEGMPVVL